MSITDVELLRLLSDIQNVHTPFSSLYALRIVDSRIFSIITISLHATRIIHPPFSFWLYPYHIPLSPPQHTLYYLYTMIFLTTAEAYDYKPLRGTEVFQMIEQNAPPVVPRRQ